MEIGGIWSDGKMFVSLRGEEDSESGIHKSITWPFQPKYSGSGYLRVTPPGCRS